MPKCNGCAVEFDPNELDQSGFCYECANYDPDPKPDLVGVTVAAAKTAAARIYARLGRKPVGEVN